MKTKLIASTVGEVGEMDTNVGRRKFLAGAASVRLDGRSVHVRLDEPARVRAALRTSEIESVQFERWPLFPRPVLITLGHLSVTLDAGRHDLDLNRMPVFAPLGAMLVVEARTRSGARHVAAAPVKLLD